LERRREAARLWAGPRWASLLCAGVALAGAVAGSARLAAGTAAAQVRGEKLGYWVVRADGSVTGFGLPALGDLSAVKLVSPIVGGAAVPGGGGYWLVAANGGVYSFGDARFFGSPGAGRLNRPIVGMVAAPGGAGYWLVARDGGIFAYGDARFFGSTGHIHLNKGIVGMAATPDGRGYWLVASDGGIFAFGDARFFGSMGAKRLNRPIVGMAATPDGRGYWLVASDGGTFAFGDAAFMGSAGSAKLASPVVGLARTSGGAGYWMAERDGTVLHFGAAGSPAAASRDGAGGSSGQGPRAAPQAQRSRVVAILASEQTGAAAVAPSATTLPSTTVPTTTVPTTTVPPEATTLPPATTTVPATSTTARPPATTVPIGVPYSTPYPPGATGYDVSWPQCSPLGSPSVRSLPAVRPFAIVGVNGGTIGSFNSCFAAEAAWAGPELSVYIILQPAPSNNPVQETTGPDASCAATSSVCEGYDWGYNYAQADLAFVRSEGYTPRVWWLDVETGEGWPTSTSLQPVNSAIVQGALDAIRAGGDTVGIYSTWYQWGKITGSYLPGGQPPIWVPGALSLSGGDLSAVSYCQRAQAPGDPSKLSSPDIGFANGVPWLVQYGYDGSATGGVDPDYSCA
jgi:hypothetical protein